MSRVEGVAVVGGFRHGADASVSTLTTVPLQAHRTRCAVFPHWALVQDQAWAYAELAVRPFRRVRPVAC